jgi:hypothetical protein
MTRRRTAFFALGATVVFVVGCHRIVRPPVPGAAIRGGAEALAIVERRETDTGTLTATFKIVLHRPDGSEEASRGAVVVARPDRLRLQIFSFGVMTTYDFTANGDRFRVRTPFGGGQRIGRFGETAADGGENALGDDLRPLFLGARGTGRAKVSAVDDRFVVSIPEATGRREIDVSKRDGRIVRETLFAGEEPTLAIDYGDYRDVDGVPLPFAITVAVPAKGLSLAIEIAGYTRNEPVDPKLFEF